MQIDIPLEVTTDEYEFLRARYDEHGGIYLYDVDFNVYCSCGALLAVSVKMVKGGILVTAEPCIFCKDK